MSITIKELVDVVAEAGETTKVNAEKQIVALFEKVGASLKAGEEVTIRDFGRFYVKTRPARTGRNPKTGAAVEVPAKNVIKFAPRGSMK